jgi:hypothetical protein
MNVSQPSLASALMKACPLEVLAAWPVKPMDLLQNTSTSRLTPCSDPFPKLVANLIFTFTCVPSINPELSLRSETCQTVAKGHRENPCQYLQPLRYFIGKEGIRRMRHAFLYPQTHYTYNNFYEVDPHTGYMSSRKYNLTLVITLWALFPEGRYPIWALLRGRSHAALRLRMLLKSMSLFIFYVESHVITWILVWSR